MTTGPFEDIFGPLSPAKCEICGAPVAEGPETTCRNGRCVVLLCPKCMSVFASYGPIRCGCEQ